MLYRGKDRRMGRGYAKMQNWKKAVVDPQRGREHRLLRRDGGGLRWASRTTSRQARHVATNSGYDFKELTPGKLPEKKLLEGQSKSGGRNAHGRITSRFRGGGPQAALPPDRLAPRQDRRPGDGRVHTSTIPTAPRWLALLHYADGEKTYILAPDGLKVGDKILASRNADIKPGNSMPLRHIPLGTMIHNIEMRKGKGAQLVRAAGSGASLMAKDGDYAQVRMPSGEVRMIHQDCQATIGQVSNIDHANNLDRQGRSYPLARQASASARRYDEPR